VPRMHSPNVNEEEENGDVGPAEEVSVNQVFGKMMKILNSITEKKGTRGKMKHWNVSLNINQLYSWEKWNRIKKPRYGLRV
jgi:ribosomal protein L3